MLTIEAIAPHWLGPDPDADLCAHGGVRVTAGDEVLLETGEVTISTGALHLLRALDADHTPEHPVGEHLLPCCGHFMYPDEAGALVNLGCPHGTDFQVRHRDGGVVLAFGEREIIVTRGEWRRAVVGFADAVAAFYAASAPRRPQGSEWYDAFWREWKQRRAVETE